MKVVLVDDESLIRMDLRDILESGGCEIIGEGANGVEAIRLAKQLQPDVILMDVKMPKMDGITAARLINDKHIAPVLLLTAYSQTDLIEKAKEAGVLAYLVKPIREEQLFPAIEIARSRFAEIKTLGEELDYLKESLETRKLLDRAKGILMAAHNITEAEAYRKMQQYSMNQRTTLKELAEAIIAAAAKRK